MDLYIDRKTRQDKTLSIKNHGSKNSSVALIPACLLSSGIVTLTNVPRIKDTEILVSIIRAGGHNISFQNHSITVSRIKNPKLSLPPEVSLLRASSYFIGVYLALYKNITIPMCGGCNFGNRPLNYHFDAFKKLGVEIEKSDNLYHFKAVNLHPEDIYLPFPSLGATLNIIFLATSISGTTTIYNYAKDPEVIDVINFLNYLGANIKISKNYISISKTKSLSGGTYQVMPDRIEACTYLSFVACNILPSLRITNTNPKDYLAFCKLLSKLDCIVYKTKNSIYIKKKKHQSNNPINVNIGTYPGIPTDLQPIITSILVCNNREGSITDSIYPNRFAHAHELTTLGANITREDNTITVSRGELKGGIITAHDLRCAASLILASCACNESVIIRDIDYLFRGYEGFIDNLKLMGFKVKIIMQK